MDTIKGISPEQLQRYVEMRDRINAEASTIENITSMFALFETCGEDTIAVDPVAFGKINQMLNTHILNIWEILDDFIYLLHAKMALEKLGEMAE